MVHRRLSLAICLAGLIVADISIAMAVASKPGYELFFEFLSELGRSGLASQWFNYGLVAAGAILAIFFLSLAIALESKLARIGSLIGIACGIALSSVGIFPITTASHFGVSAAFFILAFLSAILLAISSKKEKEISPKIFWFGIGFMILDLAFIAFFSSPFLETIAVIAFQVWALALALGRKP